MATRTAKTAKRGKDSRGASRSRRQTIFFPARNRRLADIITIESPTAFRRSIRELAKQGLDAHEKRALVLAQNRARAMLKKKDLSVKERRELKGIASIELPPVTR